MIGPIDAVITWVDGEDPAHIAKRRQFEPGFGAAGTESTRFANCDEIRFCLAALLRFAPWLRNVHILTDGQIPAIVTELWASDETLRSRIKIVDHRETFRGHEELLPAFSSRSIESTLFRIPDLAELFLYLNDDFFLTRPIEPTDFFSSTGPILRGHMMTRAYGFLPIIRHTLRRAFHPDNPKPPAGFKHAQLTAARLVSRGLRFFTFGHTPHPLRRSTLQSFDRDRPGYILANMAPRFRDASQFNPISLANHLEIAQGTASFAPDNTVYFRADVDKPKRIREKIAEVESRADVFFICINSLDQAEAEVQAEILAFLRSQIL